MNRSQILTPLTPACFSPSFSLSLSLTSTTHLLHIPSLGFWVEDHEGSHHPHPHLVLCPGKWDWKSAKLSPHRNNKSFFIRACGRREFCPANSLSTAWPVVSAHHPHHDYVEGQLRCRRQCQPWHLSSPDPYLVPSL